MTSQEGMPAGWYDDPSGVGELRYHDGAHWTEHVTIDGAQTTAPFEPPEVDIAGTSSFRMSRVAQWRTEDEKPVQIVGPTGVLGSFVTKLDGAPGYRFQDAAGGTVLSMSKPGLKSSVHVDDPAGYPIGTITKVGRLHSRYDITRAEGGPTATMKLVPGATDEWDLHVDDQTVAHLTRTTATEADSLNLAAVEYAAEVVAPLDDQLQHLLLVTPMAIDILDTQTL